MKVPSLSPTEAPPEFFSRGLKRRALVFKIRGTPRRNMKRALLAMGWAVVGAGMLLPAVAAGQTQTPAATRQERRAARHAARSQDAEEWREAWTKISPEDRATLSAAWRNAVEGIKDLTPEQKQRLTAAAQSVGEELKNLTPEQKKRLQDRLQRAAANYAALTAEQKQVILGNMSDSIERMRNVTPEQRQRLLALYRKLLGL
jgi:hypothetical protein